jgi:hypothetical protein
MPGLSLPGKSLENPLARSFAALFHQPYGASLMVKAVICLILADVP